MKQVIGTNQAPQAIGTYSQAVKAGDTVYFSGQIGLIPETMKMIEGDFQDEVHQVFKNIKALSHAAGGDLSQIVKLNISILTMEKFAIVNEVMAEYFDEPYPARAVVAVQGLPKDAAIEIEAIMLVGE